MVGGFLAMRHLPDEKIIGVVRVDRITYSQPKVYLPVAVTRVRGYPIYTVWVFGEERTQSYTRSMIEEDDILPFGGGGEEFSP